MANIEVKLRRGTTSQHGSFTGAQGEVTVDTDLDTLRVHDGSTAGGIRLAKHSELGGGGTGTVTSVDSGTGLTGGPITTSGTLAIANDGVNTTQIADDAVIADKISSTDNTFKVSTTDVVVNEGGADIDFRVEGDANANLINADAGENIVGIGVTVDTSDTFSSGTTYKAQVKDGLRVINDSGVAKLKLLNDEAGGGGASITLKSTTAPSANEGHYSIFTGDANGILNFKNETANKTINMDASGDWYSFTNTQDLGKTGSRWDDVWSNGTFNGSDQNIKQDIEELNEAEKRVAVKCKGLIKKYRLKDAVAEKGANARIHVGIIAQELQAAFESEGLDAFRYSMIGRDTWWEGTDSEGNREVKYEATEGYTEVTQMSVRYNELLAFIIAAM
jgi:hypothetical protein|tara:strand:+ start:8663 stop:9832 length:1170 start_codon:yes stop_codon:yes gene_type:complete